jgi:hypothetical protein
VAGKTKPRVPEPDGEPNVDQLFEDKGKFHFSGSFVQKSHFDATYGRPALQERASIARIGVRASAHATHPDRMGTSRHVGCYVSSHAHGMIGVSQVAAAGTDQPAAIMTVGKPTFGGSSG